MSALDDGLVLVVKQDCPTCRLIEPVVRELSARGALAALLSQDYPAFLAGLPVQIDHTLEHSYRLGIDVVPTLLRRRGGSEIGRASGWHRGEWQALTGLAGLGAGLRESRPGCGSRSAMPAMAEALRERYGETGLASREVRVEFPADPVEQAFDLGWSDGLPVVPPTPERVLRMLEGTRRDPAEVVAEVPPSGAPCTVEKAAVNAVMAGCRPDYLPLVLAAIEAAADPAYAWQGLLATTMGAGNVLVVNGPVARAIGMNAGINALGHGNRANMTVPRALQLVSRNIGGALPGATDRSCQGHPGKLGLAFAEHEDDRDWPSLARSRGVAEGRSAATVYAGVGSVVFFDERSRTPVDLLASFVAQVQHLRGGRERRGIMVVVSPEHRAVLRSGRWGRDAFVDALLRETGMHAEDLLVTLAGGGAGLMSTVIPGWGAGDRGSQPVTREVTP